MYQASLTKGRLYKLLDEILHRIFVEMKGRVIMSKRRFYAVFCCVLLLLCLGLEKEVYQETMKEEGKEAETLEKKIAFLTFDDGPSKVTEEVLKALKEANAKATFFLIGEQITEETAPLLRQMVEEGHELGIHTYSHRSDEIYQSADAYVADALKAAERIEEAAGTKPRYFRFPWGSKNKYAKGIKEEIVKRMEEKGYIYFDWNVSGEDSVGRPDMSMIYKNVKKDVLKYNEPVVLLHDSGINKNTAKTLPDILKMLKEAGYEFETVDKRSKPYQYH